MIMTARYSMLFILCMVIQNMGGYDSQPKLNEKLIKLNKKLIKKVKKPKTFDFTIKSLLKAKADPNAVDEDGVTALHHLLWQEKPSLKKVMLFLEHNVDCNKISPVQMSVVQMSLTYYTGECPLGCLSYRFYQNNGKLALHVRALLEAKADPNMINLRGDTLLHELIYPRDISDQSFEPTQAFDFIKYVIDQKGDVNIKGRAKCNPFHVLFYNENRGSYDFIKLFLESQGDANQRDNKYSKRSPFQRFFSNHTSTGEVDYKTLNLFLEHKADPNSILVKALTLQDRDLEDFKLIRYLFDKGARPEAGYRVLTECCSNNEHRFRLLRIFLEHNMDPIIMYEQHEAYELLESGKKIVSMRSQEQFPYECAVTKGERNVLAYAIPYYIKQKYRALFKIFLMCLNDKKKTCHAFKVPKPITRLFFEKYIAEQVNRVDQQIQKIEDKEHWSYHESKYLKNSMKQLVDDFTP